jgi:hypothetical protein
LRKFNRSKSSSSGGKPRADALYKRRSSKRELLSVLQKLLAEAEVSLVAVVEQLTPPIRADGHQKPKTAKRTSRKAETHPTVSAKRNPRQSHERRKRRRQVSRRPECLLEIPKHPSHQPGQKQTTPAAPEVAVAIAAVVAVAVVLPEAQGQQLHHETCTVHLQFLRSMLKGARHEQARFARSGVA